MLLVTADLHVSANPRDAYRKRWVEGLPALLKKHKAETLLILGDLTEVKDGHEAELVNFMADTVAECAAVSNVVILQGNHDWLSGPDNAYFRFLSHIENVDWISQPTTAEDLLEGQSWTSVLLPHSTKPSVEWRFLEEHQENFFDFAFCHQAFAGARAEGGRVLEGTPLTLIPKRTRIISGDVHNPQDVNRQLTYVGAPYTVDFGDTYDPRFLLIDKLGNIRSVPCTGPQKVVLDVSDPSIFENAKKLEELELIPGDVIKMNISITREQYADWKELTQKIYEWGRKERLLICGLIPNVESNITKKLVVKRSNLAEDPEVVKRFAESRGLDKPTTQAGLGLLK